MIADLDDTIRELLEQEMPINNGEIEVAFDQPKREWSARLNRPTVNLFLYDLRENPTLRQHQWEEEVGSVRGDPLAHLKRSPFRIDCFYMLTAWAADPEDEHRLLSRALLALLRHPTLPANLLAGSLKNQPYEIQARLAVHDRLTNPAEVWSALDNEIRPSIPYILTLALDPWTPITTPLVRTVTLRSGQADSLPGGQRLRAGTELEHFDIGGTVRDSSPEHAPLAGIQVAIKGTGLFATSDERGRFTLGSLPPGGYTLVAWPTQGPHKEKPVTLPSPDGNFDLEI